MSNLTIYPFVFLGGYAGPIFGPTMIISCYLDLNRVFSFGYSNQHKWFKCLDISEGRVYIYMDAIFDDSVFPFTKLHSNAGACLRVVISLLPSHLVEPYSRGCMCNR
jgi:hypothetical protein